MRLAGSTSTTRPATPDLRWLTEAYEQAQRARISTGDQLRALLRQRGAADGARAEELLEAIRRGATDGPTSLLGRSHRRHWEAEVECATAIGEALAQHPAGAWLCRVEGLDLTLVAKLLSRLDVTRASTPSAFWAYCGLATVPGAEYRCATCGYTAAYPERYPVPSDHPAARGGGTCAGKLRRTRGPEDGVRVAPRPAAPGERSSYDQQAKNLMYQIGTSFLGSRSPYAAQYEQERARLARERRGWASQRQHLAALRKAEKLFLSHLWLVWREALGLPLTQPYPGAAQAGSVVDPWALVGGKASEGVGSKPPRTPALRLHG